MNKQELFSWVEITPTILGTLKHDSFYNVRINGEEERFNFWHGYFPKINKDDEVEILLPFVPPVNQNSEFIRYKGNGEHSVNELEKIIEQREEELHLLKVIAPVNKEITKFNVPLVCSALCDAIDDNQEGKIHRHVGMFIEIEKVLRSQLLSPTPSIEGEEAVKFAEWLIESYERVYSVELDKFAYVNCIENAILTHGNDYHFTKLINEHGETVQEAFAIYTQQKQSR